MGGHYSCNLCCSYHEDEWRVKKGNGSMLQDSESIKGRFKVMGQLHISVEDIETSSFTEKQLLNLLDTMKQVYQDLKTFACGDTDFHSTAIEIGLGRILYITSSNKEVNAFVVDEKNHVIDLKISIKALDRVSLCDNLIVGYLRDDRVLTPIGYAKDEVQPLTEALFSNIEKRGPPEKVIFHEEEFDVHISDMNKDASTESIDSGDFEITE